MGKKCALKYCESNLMNSLSVFELSDQLVNVDKWINFLKIHGIVVENGKKYYLCQLHFEEEMILKNDKRSRLKTDAYPSKVSSYLKLISNFQACF